MVFSVTLNGGSPWGFRLQGGREFNEPIRIAKINPNSKAYNEGIQVGDYVESINGQRAKGLEHQNAQQLIKAATDQLILELTRVGSKSNGTMNGDIHNHIDHELEILNSGEIKPTKPYKPVSFTRQQSSPSSQFNIVQNSPMTVTVNTKKVKSRTAPASPVLQRQFRTAPTSPVTFQSVLKIPPLSPGSTHKALGSRMAKPFITGVSADDTAGHWSTPTSSCPPTPPRPRLPIYFKPTPFLPRNSPPPVLPRHLTEHLPPDEPEFHPDVPSPNFRQRTFLSDFSHSSDEGSHRFRPVIPSPKPMRRKYLRDFSPSSADRSPIYQPVIPSPKSSRSTFLRNVSPSSEEVDATFTSAVHSPKSLRRKFFNDFSHDNVESKSTSISFIQSPRPVQSFDQNISTNSEEGNTQPSTVVPSMKLVLSMIQDYSVCNDEEAIEHITVVPSPKPVQRMVQDYSVSNDEENIEHIHVIPSPKPVRSMVQDYSVSNDKENIEHIHVMPSPKPVRRMVQDYSVSNDEENIEHIHAMPSPKPVRSMVQDYSVSSEEGNTERTTIIPCRKPQRKKLFGGISTKRKDNTRKTPPVVPSKPVRRKFWQSIVPSSEDNEIKSPPIISALKPLRKTVSQEFSPKKEETKSVSSQAVSSPSFLERRKLQDLMPNSDESKTTSSSVPASPKLTLKEFWRDYSPSSEKDVSDAVRPLAGTKGASRLKKSKGLSLFRRMRRQLSDMGIPDEDDLEPHRTWQQASSGGSSAAERNVSVEDHGWSLPIKIESRKKQAFGSPQSRSFSLDSPRSHDSPRSQPQNVVPPPRDFASGHGDLPREIPVVFEGISHGLRSLRQIPVEVEQGQNNDLAQSVSIERSPIQRALLREQHASTEMDNKQGRQPEGPLPGSPRREIPIQIKRGPFTSQTSIESDSKPDSPRQIRIERDKKKRADLEKRRIDLERDIDNVINDAIRQVPIYDKQTKQEIKPPPIGQYPDIAPPVYGAQQSEYIIPTKIESMREKRVEEAIQHQIETGKKDLFEKKLEDRNQPESSWSQPTTSPGSYATLPVKKRTPSVNEPPRQTFESDTGSYSTLPSFRQKGKNTGSPKLQRSIIHDDDVCFSDIEGGRGRSQPSWRPMHSPLQSRHVWKPRIQEKSKAAWAPTASPEQQKRELGMSRTPVSRSVSESQAHFDPTDRGQFGEQSQKGIGFIPIQKQHGQRPRKVGDLSYDDEKDSSLSSFDTMETSSEPKINGTLPPVKSSPKPGVWKPGMQHSPPAPVPTKKPHKEVIEAPSLKDVPQKWAPVGPGGSSGKGYRPIKTEFSSRAQSNISAITAPESSTKPAPTPEDSYAWKPSYPAASTDSEPTSAFSYKPPSPSHTPYSYSDPHRMQDKPELHMQKPSPSHTSLSYPPPESSTSTSHPAIQNGLDHHVSTSMLHLKDEPSRLPPSQSPYITLLQKNRDDEEVVYFTDDQNEGHGHSYSQGQENGYPKGIEFVGDPIMVTEEGKIPKGAIYLGKSESMEGDVKHTDTYYAVPSDEKPTVRTETVSSPKRYEDIGPIDQESGMPLSFRQNVDEEKQHDWYKQMYRSLHRTKKKEAINNYKPTYQWPDDDDKSDTKSVDVTTTESPRSESLTQSEEPKSYFALASPKSAGALSPRSLDLSSKCSELSPTSVKSADFSPKNSEKSPSSLDFKFPSAISDPLSSKPTKSSTIDKSDKNKFTITNVSETLRRDAKFPSGKQDKSDDVFLSSKESKSDDEQDINPYRPSYEMPSRSVRGDISSGYLSEPEYRSKLRSKSTSNVSRTARALDIGTLPTDLEEFIKYLDEWSPPNARSTLEVYRNQPRSIVDYEPGFSSIAFRESKTQRSDRPKSYTGLSPAERQKIAKRRSQSLKRKAGSHNPPPELPGQYSTYTEGRRRLVSEPTVNNHEAEDEFDAYKKIQKGGEIPIKGLQKPAPEKSPNKIQSQKNSSYEPIKTSETNHQPVTKSHTSANHLQSQPITKHDTNDKSLYRTNGPILSGYIPNPPVRNPLRISIPSSKPKSSRRPSRKTQSAAEQLGVKSPPPVRANGVDEESNDNSAFRHMTTDELRSQHRPSNKDRRRREEEEAYRKRRLEQIYEEERRKKIVQQQADIESRKHSDFLLPSQKSPIPVDRFEYGTVPESRRRGFKIQGKARGLYNFTAQNSRELPFRKGDLLYLIRQIDGNWFEGERNGRVGIFPVNYAEILTSIEEATSAAEQSEGQARARYTFNSQTSVELSLRKGEVVTLLRNVDDNWFEGRVGNQQGIFPVAYVEVLREPSTPLVTPAPSVITTPMTGRGTPEMLSPVSYDGAPTPPPQPSPGAFRSSTLDRLDYPGNRYPTSPRDQHDSSRQHENRITSPRTDRVSPQRYNGVQSQKHYDQAPSSRHMNGGYSSLPQHSHNDYSVRSRQSPQQIRKDNPPSLNITAKSVSTPDINSNISKKNYSKSNRQQEEDLAVARYRAIYAYKPQNEDELELLEGDEIYVMEKCDDGWYVGTSLRTGMFGTFPGNYVTRSQ